MALKIYDSVSKRKDEFEPLRKGCVKIYACGPTVYDEPHIGHLRSAYVFEMIRNYLKSIGYKVTFVRNVTDIDDKIIEKARAQGGDLKQGVLDISRKYFDLYKHDLRKLGIQDPDIEPRATEFIPDMISMIKKLIDSEHAYSVNGNVYFDVNTFGSYGEISHQKMDQLIDHVRLDHNPDKEDIFDFALWKKSKEDEPSWPSPWGPGRPGWHIECSAMSLKCFDNAFDIHGGGRDLIFPHHENENAQSKCANNMTSFVQHWVHHGLITVNGQKMSKSLKNFVTLSDLEGKYAGTWDTDLLRLLFLGTHYSMPLDYSDDKMKMELTVWKKFYLFFSEAVMKKRAQSDSTREKDQSARVEKYESLFREAMNDDFNAPQALTVMHGMLHEAWKADDDTFLCIADQLRKFGKVFGLFSHFGESSFFGALDVATEVLVAEKIEARQAAKKSKNFKSADEIRKELLSKYNIELLDKPDGSTEWRRRV